MSRRGPRALLRGALVLAALAGGIVPSWAAG